MNLSLVKYGWLLFKFKASGLEVEGANVTKVTGVELGQIMHAAEQFIHRAKVAMWKARDVELAAIAATEEKSDAAEASQLEFDMSN
ncbi:hypothetical protein LCGC14_1477020 [marine sediment metagenome]|uniref:Uncharacterized protein n=1 Tax=marine sediment metagenome TaxID=412755 RepID=A0A0F9JAP6_9ZZZZ